MYRQLMETTWRIIMHPTWWVISTREVAKQAMSLTKINVQPVAHGGMEAKMGAKKMEMKKHSPVVMAVRPVLPPSAIPAPLSMNAVTELVPNKAPTLTLRASEQ